VAHALMTAALAAAVERGAETIWLGVWERNPRAIAFYRKWGFEDVGSHDFLLGNDRQIDRLMVRAVIGASG
jgi:ribosomal protein S18 acetylase RimI-like enzyme